jgi:hypothetical protein
MGHWWYSIQQGSQFVSWIKSQFKTTVVMYTTGNLVMLVLVKGILRRGDISHCMGYGPVVGLSEHCNLWVP